MQQFESRGKTYNLPDTATHAAPGACVGLYFKDGDELVVSPFSGGAAGVELMATHDSGCCVFDDPKVIRDLANQLLSVADAVESAQGAEK